MMKGKSLTPEKEINASQIFPYATKITLLDGSDFSFESCRGKEMLIVNTASVCGFTPQYETLERIWKEKSDRLAIIAFPCNDFGAQEPGSAEEIQVFCEKNYGVTFPIAAKMTLKENVSSPVYQWLTNPELNGWNSEKPEWNFCKFHIDEKGYLRSYHTAAIDPATIV